MARSTSKKVVIIGAGIGGLSAAVDLAAQGLDVTVLEQAFAPGGQLRQFPSDAGPVNVGPAAVTLRPVFDSLFARAGTRLDDYVTLTTEPTLARHWWQDGSSLDLFTDPNESAKAIADFAGREAHQEFLTFSKNARRFFEAFDEPILQNVSPSLAVLGKTVLRDLRGLLPAFAPTQTLARSLEKTFSDPRLRQLFGRYASSVGGSPYTSPALLSMIWDVESRGSWRVKGGLVAFAKAFEKIASEHGAKFRYGATVEDILIERGKVAGVILHTGERIDTQCVVYNGDPTALAQGMLGDKPRKAVKRRTTTKRSLSAYVWAFAAQPSGVDLHRHNVFFGKEQRNEFDAVDRGEMPSDPTLGVCAQDRGDGLEPPQTERFEIVMNGAPIDKEAPEDLEEFVQCRSRTFQTLERMNLDFDVLPQRISLITPGDLAVRFPGTNGSLNGRKPNGVRATFQRPTARSRIPGLYLAGGDVHPGVGLPMTSLSGQHAAAAIMTDLAMTVRTHRVQATNRPSMTPSTANDEPMQLSGS